MDVGLAGALDPAPKPPIIVAMLRDSSGNTIPQQVRNFDDIRTADLVIEQPVPDAAIDQCRQLLEKILDSEVSNYLNRGEMLKRHREIGDANKAFLYMLACGMLKSARQRPSVRDPEKPNQVIAEAREMADEDRLIIFDLQINEMPQTQKRDLIVLLGAAVHSNQW